MNARLGLILLFIVTVVAGDALASAGQRKQETRNRYEILEVVPFGVKEGIEIPPEYVSGLTDEVVHQLRRSKKFKQVALVEDTSIEPAALTVRLTGTVTQFKRGSRAKRYVIGFGVGKTKIVAHIQFIDRTTGEMIFEDDVDGKVVIGIFGGDSKGAMGGVAKEVVKVTKKRLF